MSLFYISRHIILSLQHCFTYRKLVLFQLAVNRNMRHLYISRAYPNNPPTVPENIGQVTKTRKVMEYTKDCTPTYLMGTSLVATNRTTNCKQQGRRRQEQHAEIKHNLLIEILYCVIQCMFHSCPFGCTHLYFTYDMVLTKAADYAKDVMLRKKKQLLKGIIMFAKMKCYIARNI